jgi:hypothetical protein
MNRRTFSVLSAGLFLEALVGCSKKSSRPRQQIFNSEARALPTDHPNVIFTDVTRQAGIDFVHSAGVRTHQLPEDMGSGAAWGDYDNDGYPDLYLVNQPGPWGQPLGPNSPTSRLYHNNGDGTFTDVTDRAGVANRGGFGMGAAWGDYDNDGLLDLYVTNYGRSVLYHNNGDGTFTDVTDRAGVANHRWGMTPVWLDYDNDGYLDLYVPNYVDYNLKGVPAGATSQEYGIDVPFTLNPASFAPVPNRLYHNNRDGTFTDVAPRLRVADASGRSLSVAFADFTLNGWQDIYVGNDISSNRLYQNLGHGRFQDVSASSWSEEYRGTMGIAIGDFDRDGDLDMFLSHWIGQGDALYQNLWNEQKSAGKLHFENVADMYGCGAISYSTAGWGTFFFDFDNDGWLDLLVLNGSTFEDKSDTTKLVPEKPFLLWSKGEDGFFDLAASGVAGSALQIARNARGAAYADYDRDGDLDMIVTTNHGRAVLLRNDGGNRNHWLCVHLIGTRSNRQGIGARLLLEAGGKRYLRQYGVQGSYLSSSIPEAWFGLGQIKQIDSLTIAWPSGSRQVFRDLPIDRTLAITEGRSVWEGKTATPSRV